ncbi:hypothetical protein IW261DRAFT_1564649 [Armillaria novae-zelandiae]|uniref:Uncharacterized protein n=1 Tax=Armillaria novae-zelandiae TaxID=153914 RepID=A0AA39P7Y8_9AGAR|nr:hypothetical protein IW261DRAFT_1564649 [Armillaria novae-zelandiae]
MSLSHDLHHQLPFSHNSLPPRLNLTQDLKMHLMQLFCSENTLQLWKHTNPVSLNIPPFSNIIIFPSTQEYLSVEDAIKGELLDPEPPLATQVANSRWTCDMAGKVWDAQGLPLRAKSTVPAPPETPPMLGKTRHCNASQEDVDEPQGSVCSEFANFVISK